ncbi:MAG: NADH:flavin oxidoreductase/NADH oxidase [Betaproteobacteria bacterium]|nr:MAG: NADH:flavin oxidoreductase/NADH oxidase [Betaproteobacteria bacterium]
MSYPVSKPERKAPLLFEPITLRGVTARNRIVVSPMCQFSSVDGGPTDWHLVNSGKYAIAGAGVVFTEETAVEARGRKTHECAGLYSNSHIAGYRRITEFVRARGAVPAIQLGHAGRKASCDSPWNLFRPLIESDLARGLAPWTCVSASAVPAPREGSPVPVALSVSEIGAVIGSWREAARRSVDAGFDICEIHGAHGYLMHQFLSPLANRRTDAYGGDLRGRMRFALEVVEAVRTVWPHDRPLFFRVSAMDGPGGMWSLEDTVELSRELVQRGVDVITCSSGGIGGPMSTEVVPRVPGYHVPYCERVRRETGARTCAVGLITEPHHAEQILQSGQADLIALARELLYDPHWPVHAANALGLPGYLDVLPREFSWWLKRREQLRTLTADQ